MMKRWMILAFLFILPGLIFGCGKGKETSKHEGHQEGVKQEAVKREGVKPGAVKQEAAKAREKKPAVNMEMEMKGLTMESIQKEGKMQAVAPGTVQISPERQKLIGVKIGTAEMKSLERVIRTVGRVDYDEKRIVTVSPKIGGWIEDLYVDFTGRFVRQDEPLLTIYSPELVATQEEYLLALRAKKEFSKSPFLEVARSGDSLAEAAVRRLKLWDITDDQIKALEESGQSKKTLTLYSPFSGFVLEKNAYKGMNVMPGMALFKLVDLSVVWLYADIYEFELPFVGVGQQASIQIASLPGQVFTGKAIYIYPSLNPETRTAKVRFELANSHGKLKPEMFANVELKGRLGQKLTVPVGAIIDTGTRQLAIVAKGSGYFEPREVKAVRADDYYEVIKGLKPGEQVVTSASFLIDSESNLKEAMGGMAGMDHGK